MKHLYFLLLSLAMLAAGPAQAQAPYVITAQLGPYQQDFDDMGSGGTPAFINGANASLPGIIAGFKSGTSFGSSPPAGPNDGTNVNSTAYNFGTSGSGDRALGGMAGSLAGFNTTGYVAVRLRNRAKTKIRNFDIRYALEQWYNSSNAQDAYVYASYRVYTDTTSFALNDIAQDNGINGWADIPNLKLQAPATAGKVGKADGNSTTYRRTAQYRLTDIDLANGQEIVVRFSYVFNSNTNGNGVSVDDIVIYPETNVLYSNASGLLDNADNTAGGTWTLLADGNTRPASAVNFAAPNCTYYVQGTSTASRFSNWQVTGANSRVVVGTDAAPATLYVGPTDDLAATVDVTNGSTLDIANPLTTTSRSLVMGTLATTSTVKYTGAAAQNVLPATYANLVLAGTAPKTLTGTVTIARALTISQAVALGANNLTLLRGATLSRVAGGQVVATGTGEYRATVVGAGSSSTAVLFPMASGAGAANYLPVTITAGATDRDDTYRVRTIDGLYTSYSTTGTAPDVVYAAGPTASPSLRNVNVTWLISHETTTPVAATLNIGWSAAKQGSGFVLRNAHIDHYTASWDNSYQNVGYTTDDANNLTWAQRTGVSNFSPFAVTSATAGPLPVTLVSFEARRVGTTVACTWATASELHNDHFVVERSLDGASFAALGTVAGSGTSAAARTYTFVDAQPAAGVAYYRLRQVDADGTATYAPAVAVPGGELAAATEITAVPNPSTGQFALLTNFAASTQLRGTVMNMLGQSVATIAEMLPAGAARLPLDLSAQPAGVYLVHLLGPAGPTTLRLLKQ